MKTGPDVMFGKQPIWALQQSFEQREAVIQPLMEATALPITTWVWLLAPMALVLALSIITFFMEDRD